MSKSVKNLLSIVLSVLIVVSCFAVTAVHAEDTPTPAQVMLHACDTIVASNPNPTVDTVNYTEGAGSLLQQWETRNNFNLYLAQNSGVDITSLIDADGKFYFAFDVYVKDQAEITNLTKLNRLLVVVGTVAGISGWKGNIAVDIKSGTYTSTGTWAVGWNHIEIPVDVDTDITGDGWNPATVGFTRIFADGFNRAGYFQVDNVRFVNSAYIDQKADEDYAVIDTEVAIRSLPETLTAEDAALLKSVEDIYKAYVAKGYKRKISNYEILKQKQLEYDYNFCEQAGDFDAAFGDSYSGGPTVSLDTDNYTAKDRSYTQNLPVGQKGHSIIVYDKEGLDFSSAVDAENRFYVLVDVYLSDPSVLLNHRRMYVYLGTVEGIDEALAKGSAAGSFSTTMIQHWGYETYFHDSYWKSGWNTMAIAVDTDELTDAQKEFYNGKLGYVMVWSDSNVNETAVDFTIGDVRVLSNKTYYEKGADIISGKQLTAKISAFDREITLEDESALTALKAEYDGASDSVKGYVGNSDVLTNAVKTIADWKSAAVAVDEKITAAGEATVENKDTIKSIVDEYDALDEEAKTLVTKADAIENYKSFLAEVDDIVAAAETDVLIDAIGEVTEDSGDAISAARESYDALSADAKIRVTKLDVLEAAEEKYAEITALVYGDIDDKEGVTAGDALMVLQCAVKKITLDETQQKAADVDGEEGITAGDALLVLQFAVGKIDEFPVEKAE